VTGPTLTSWLEEKSAEVRPTTLRDYARHVQTHLVPHLGQVRLRDLRTSQVTGLLRQLSSDGLGPTTVRRVHATLRSALGDAVRAELVQVNAATHAVAPKVPRPKVDPWQPEE